MSESSDRTDVMGSAPRSLAVLGSAIRSVPARLFAISPDRTAAKPAPGRWSAKEELGHLIDSATVNHQRIVRTTLENCPILHGYDGDEWVALHRYQEAHWFGLIETWKTMNDHLLAAVDQLDAATWARTCTIAGADPITLAFLVDDYLSHMLGHLRHIGIEVDDLPAAARAGGSELSYPEKPAPADYSINDLMKRRWSPRLFENRPVEREKVLVLLEAARWAPSCFGEQPWRYLVFDGSDAEAMGRARDCLVEGNTWAHKAPLLLISIACDSFAKTGKPNRWAQHDVGLASENLVLMAVELGLAAHQMAGFDADRARREFGIPPGFTPMAMIAIGYPYHARLDALDESVRRKEIAPRTRKPVREIAFRCNWGDPYGGE